MKSCGSSATRRTPTGVGGLLAAHRASRGRQLEQVPSPEVSFACADRRCRPPASPIIQRKTARPKSRAVPDDGERTSVTVVPVTSIHPPPPAAFHPAMRHPMAIAVRPDTMPLDPDIAASVPVPVARCPPPSATCCGNGLVPRRGRRDTNIDLRRRRCSNTSRDKSCCNAKRNHRISEAHSAILIKVIVTGSTSHAAAPAAYRRVTDARVGIPAPTGRPPSERQPPRRLRI